MIVNSYDNESKGYLQWNGKFHDENQLKEINSIQWTITAITTLKAFQLLIMECELWLKRLMINDYFILYRNHWVIIVGW